MKVRLMDFNGKLKYRIDIVINPQFTDRVHDLYFKSMFRGGMHYANDMEGHIEIEVNAAINSHYLMDLIDELFPYDLESKY